MSHRRRTRQRARRRGLTLIELLVVVAIIVLLATVTISGLAPIMEGRKIREAARELNAQIARARAEAKGQSRPVGIWIQRQNGRPEASLDVFLCETPPPYGGDSLSARARITGNVASLAPASGLQTLPVQIGDYIRFGFSGPKYRITQVDANSQTVTFATTTDGLPPPQARDPGVPYQIFRRPIRATARPVQMPNTAAIDLAHSGMGPAGTFNATSTEPILIVFDVDGRVKLYQGAGAPITPTADIHLLIGQAEKVGVTTDNNLQEGSALWVTIDSVTGDVRTVENSPNNSVAAARQYATAGLTKSGN